MDMDRLSAEIIKVTERVASGVYGPAATHDLTILAVTSVELQKQLDAADALVEVCHTLHGHELGKIKALEERVAELEAHLANLGWVEVK